MGIFGPSKQKQAEMRREQLASGPVAPLAQWRRHMTRPMPDYADVALSALQLAQRSPSSVDIKSLVARVVAISDAQLQAWAAKFPELDWAEVQLVMNRTDYTPDMFSDFLSTLGAKGVVFNDKLASLMTDAAPEMLASAIREGRFDLR